MTPEEEISLHEEIAKGPKDVLTLPMLKLAFYYCSLDGPDRPEWIVPDE